MALKGQKLRAYSYEEKIVIVEEHLKDRSSTYTLSKKYGIPRTTVKSWIEKYQRNGSVPKQTTGSDKSKKDITLEDYKERYEILKKYRAFLKEQRERK